MPFGGIFEILGIANKIYSVISNIAVGQSETILFYLGKQRFQIILSEVEPALVAMPLAAQSQP